MMLWNSDFPKKEGWYWFYGILKKDAPYPKLYTVEVSWDSADETYLYKTQGKPINKCYGTKGFWLPVQMPILSIPERMWKAYNS